MAQRIDFVEDTNFVLYFLEGHPQVAGYEWYDFTVSIITELELLVKPELTEEEETIIRQFLAKWPVVGITSAISARAIEVARRYRLKLPDALIAATALEAGLPLVTADRHFSRVEELNLLLLELD